MIPSIQHGRSLPHMRQAGMVLVTSLLLLVVVTILAVGLFRSFGFDERIAGNVREKQRALNAAETAEQFAEQWLSSGNATLGTVCSTLVLASAGQICSNTLASAGVDPAVVPWAIGGTPVGVKYLPQTPTPMNITTPTTAGYYLQEPRFYVSYLGPAPAGTAGGPGSIYQIDAVGWGASSSTAAVVESTYLVQTNTKDLGAP